MRRMNLAGPFILLSASLLSAAGCSENGAPSQLSLVGVHLTLSQSTLRLALTPPAPAPTALVAASVLTASGIPFPGSSLSSSSSDSTVATAVVGAAGPGLVTVQGLKPGSATVTVVDLKTGLRNEVLVTVAASGVTHVVNSASTADGFTSTRVGGPFTSGPDPAPQLSANSLSGPPGGSWTVTVGTAIPVTDILIGIPGQSSYIDINVDVPSRQINPILSGFAVTVNLDPSVVQQQLEVAVEVKDAAGIVSQPSFVTYQVQAPARKADFGRD